MERLHELLSGVGVLEGLPPSVLTAMAMVGFGLMVFGGIAVGAMFLIWTERKVAGYIQSRYGPMYTGGWHGILQSIADAVKLLMKEDIWPDSADKFLWRIAPLLVFLGAFLSYAVLPFGPTWMGANMDLGLFYVFATSSLVVMGVIAAGWGSNNKWSLYGAMRGAAQVISYEIPLGLAVLPIVMSVGSLNLATLVEAQSGWLWSWHVFNPLFFIGFIIYLISSLAEVNRTPFDLPETESELVSGYHTEYTGMKFAFFFLGEYADMFVVSAIAVTVFLGGWYTGIAPLDNILPAPLIFILKGIALVFVQIWLRWTLPRLRVDQLMHVCWKVFIPIALANLFLYGLIRTIMH